MTQITGALSRIPSASDMLRRYASDPVRLLTIVLSTVVLGYGARIDNHSPFTIPFLESLIGASITGIEFMVLLILMLEIVRRMILGDYWLERSPVSRPMLWVGIMLGLIPFLRMLLAENRFRYSLEILETPGLVIAFFLWLLVFRREDLKLMFWMVAVAGLYKGIEGVSIFLTVGLGWGLLTDWRDAMLLASMITATFFAFVIKPEGDAVYASIRRFLFAVFPITMFTFIGSTRRSFVLGVVAAIVVLAFMLEKSERRKVLMKALPMTVIFGALAMVLIGSSAFLDRLGNISDPTQEHSATYRLLEIYNVSHMIVQKPLFGWPFGVPWQNFTVLEIENLSPVVPHNTYLYVLWRGGVVGLVFWLWFLVAMFRMHRRTIRAAATPFARFLAFWLASATLAVTVAGFTMSIGAGRLKYFYPFLVVMTSYLPGAWPRLREKFSPSAPGPNVLDNA